MVIDREFLQTEIAKMEQQRNHAHDVAVASQAAIDVMKALLNRLDLPETPTGEGVENGSV
jgi:hypothetical protein